jgi:hypothetical protein
MTCRLTAVASVPHAFLRPLLGGIKTKQAAVRLLRSAENDGWFAEEERIFLTRTSRWPTKGDFLQDIARQSRIIRRIWRLTMRNRFLGILPESSERLSYLALRISAGCDGGE